MIQIRDAAREDCPGIARIQVDSYRTAHAGLFPESYLERFAYEEQTQDWQAWFATSAEDVLLVAVSADEEVVGYALARARPDIYPGYDAEILALHVRSPFQGKGFGGALLRAAIERLQGQGCQSVMLWTLKGNPVRQWYDRLQGTLIGEKSFQVGEWNILEVAYGWDTIEALLPGGGSAPAR